MKKTLIARWSLAVFLIAAGAAAQNGVNQTTFPLHGQVVAASVSLVTGEMNRWVYRVDCGDLYYDLRGGGKRLLSRGGGNRLLSIDQQIDFRIEGDKAYLSGDKKGTSYRIVGVGKASQELIHKTSQ